MNRLRGFLSLLLVAGVLVMHGWTGASGDHVLASESSPPTTVAAGHVPGSPQTVVTTADVTAVLVGPMQHAPGMAMAGACAAILLLTLAVALPCLAGIRTRLSLPGRWLRRRAQAVGPPPDLNLRLCVLRT